MTGLHVSCNEGKFPPMLRRLSDWSQNELAEFYRAVHALGKAGISVETDRGLTDDGDPWFAFFHEEGDDVLVQFSRIDDTYVISWADADGIKTIRGKDFRQLVRELVYSLMPPGPRRLYAHPASLLPLLVAAAATSRRTENTNERHQREAILMAVAAAAITAAEIIPAAAAERYDDDQVQAYAARSEHQEQSGQEHLYQAPSTPQGSGSLEPQNTHHSWTPIITKLSALEIDHLQAPDNLLPSINVGHQTYTLDHFDLIQFAAPNLATSVTPAPLESAPPPAQAERPLPLIPDQNLIPIAHHETTTTHEFEAAAPAQVTGTAAQAISQAVNPIVDTATSAVTTVTETLPGTVVPVVDQIAIQVVDTVTQAIPVLNQITDQVVLPVMDTVTQVMDQDVNTVTQVVDQALPVANAVVNEGATGRERCRE